MHRATLLFVGSLFELVAGSSLLVLPSQTITLLVDASAQEEGQTLAQMLGAGLTAMGIMLLFAAKSKDSSTLDGISIAYILYNFAGIGVMSFGALARGHDGDALWPAVAAHTILVILLLRAQWKKNLRT